MDELLVQGVTQANNGAWAVMGSPFALAMFAAMIVGGSACFVLALLLMMGSQ